MSCIEELRDLLAAATARPWAVVDFDGITIVGEGLLAEVRGHRVDADARLITAAVNALPLLLAVVEAAREMPRRHSLCVVPFSCVDCDPWHELHRTLRALDALDGAGGEGT